MVLEAQSDCLISPTGGCPHVLCLTSRFSGQGRKKARETNGDTEIEKEDTPHVMANIQSSEDNLRSLSSRSTLTEISPWCLLLQSLTRGLPRVLLSWPSMGSQIHATSVPVLYTGSGGPNSGPCVCMASSSPTGPSPQSLFAFSPPSPVLHETCCHLSTLSLEARDAWPLELLPALTWSLSLLQPSKAER